MKKRVVVLSTGGTIASSPGEDGRNVSGALPGEALVQQLALGDGYDIHVESVLQKPSNALNFDDWLTLHARIQQLQQSAQVEGIVVTHGTDTLEDTAYFLQSTLYADACPIVVTGSQRVPHEQGSDAYTNLAQAIVVAASEAARGAGVLVVFNESIFSANNVRKANSFQVNGFEAPGFGHLGYVDQGSATLLQKPVLPTPLALGAALPRVDIVPVALGMGPELFQASAHSGAQGIVIDGIGRGHVPPTWMPAIRDAIQAGVTVAITSSCLQGPLHQAYEFTGSLHELESAGVLRASNLSARKARVRLAVALSQPSTDALQNLFPYY